MSPSRPQQSQLARAQQPQSSTDFRQAQNTAEHALEKQCSRVDEALEWAETEYKLHFANSGGTVVAVVLIYIAGVSPAIQGRPAEEQAAIQVCCVVFAAAWVLLHWWFWAVVTLYRLVCSLLVIASSLHIQAVTDILHDKTKPVDDRIELLAADRTHLLGIMMRANRTIAVPVLALTGMMFLFGVVVALNIITHLDDGTKTLEDEIIPGALCILGTAGSAILFHGTTSVADGYRNYADSLLVDARLIIRADEMFPGNGLTFLDRVATDPLFGFSIQRISLDGTLFASTMSSLALTLLITIILKTLT